MQVSDKERESLLQNTKKELVEILAQRLVHPDTNRLFPNKSIEEAISILGLDVKINVGAKQQASFVIRELSGKYYVKKADMEIKVSLREEWIENDGNDQIAGLEDLKIMAEKKPIVDDLDEEEEEDGEIIEKEKKTSQKLTVRFEKPEKKLGESSDSEEAQKHVSSEDEEEVEKEKEKTDSKSAKKSSLTRSDKKKKKEKKGRKGQKDEWPEDADNEHSESSKAKKAMIWSSSQSLMRQPS